MREFACLGIRPHLFDFLGIIDGCQMPFLFTTFVDWATFLLQYRTGVPQCREYITHVARIACGVRRLLINLNDSANHQRWAGQKGRNAGICRKHVIGVRSAQWKPYFCRWMLRQQSPHSLSPPLQFLVIGDSRSCHPNRHPVLEKKVRTPVAVVVSQGGVRQAHRNVVAANHLSEQFRLAAPNFRYFADIEKSRPKSR